MYVAQFWVPDKGEEERNIESIEEEAKDVKLLTPCF